MKKAFLSLLFLLLAMGLMADSLAFQAQDLNGNAVDSSIFSKAKLTMVNVWGTFCSPCIQEMPSLAKLDRDIEDFQVLGIVIDAVSQNGKPSPRTINEAKAILMKTGATYVHIVPSKELLGGALKDIQAVPTTLFVDEKGEILQTCTGARSYASWKKLIETLRP